MENIKDVSLDELRERVNNLDDNTVINISFDIALEEEKKDGE